MTDETQDTPETEERELNQFGEAFIAGRSRKNAQRALSAADAVEISQTRVRAVRDGYFAPPEVVDRYAEMLAEETAAELAEQEAAAAEAKAQAEAEAEAARQKDETDAGAAGDDAVTVQTAPADAGDPPAEITPAGAEDVELPEGDPNSKWTVPQLDAWAAKQDPPLVFEEGTIKADKLRAIETAVNQKKE